MLMNQLGSFPHWPACAATSLHAKPSHPTTSFWPSCRAFGWRAKLSHASPCVRMWKAHGYRPESSTTTKKSLSRAGAMRCSFRTSTTGCCTRRRCKVTFRNSLALACAGSGANRRGQPPVDALPDTILFDGCATIRRGIHHRAPWELCSPRRVLEAGRRSIRSDT